MFSNLWGNSYTKFTILYIIFRFTCRELTKLAQKHSKLQNYVTNWQFFFVMLHHKHWFKFLEIALFLLHTKNLSNTTPSTAAEIFLESIFDLKQTCKILPTENFSTFQFSTLPQLVYNSVKSLVKASKLLKMLRNWGLKKTWMGYEQIFGFTGNQW